MRVEPIYRRWLLGGHLILVLLLTLAPMPPAAVRVASLPGFDKLVHLALFAGLACLIFWNRGRWSVSVAALGSALIAAGLAGLIEFLQAYLPRRTPDTTDFVAGAVGAALGAGIFAALAAAYGEGGRGKAAEPGTDQSEVTGPP